MKWVCDMDETTDENERAKEFAQIRKIDERLQERLGIKN